MQAKWMRYTARALALLWAGWWTLFGLVAGIGEGLDPLGIFMHMAVPGLLFLAAVVAAWRWELVGGVMLVLEGLATLPVFRFATTPEGFLMLAVPPLLAGVLTIIDWEVSTRERHRGEHSY